MLGHVANSAAPYATGNNLREARARDKITQNNGFWGSLPEARLGTTTVQYIGFTIPRGVSGRSGESRMLFSRSLLMQVAGKRFTRRTNVLRAAQDLPTRVTTCGRREHGPKSPKFENPDLGHHYPPLSPFWGTTGLSHFEEGFRRMLP